MPVTLLTDFDDFYVGAMRGVLESRTDENVVDIYHAVPRHDVRAGAFALLQTAPYFPDGTVHCVVVDPGVGTERRAVVVEAGDHRFVGPDNGVLLPAARELGEPRVYDAPYDAESNTFHGRDVFAPVAADVAEGNRERVASEEVHDYADVEFAEPRFRTDAETTTVTAEVVYVDSFGNAVTNLDGDDVLSRTGYGTEVVVDGSSTPFRATYAEVPEGDAVSTVGSHGMFELAVNRGSGSEEFGVGTGDDVDIVVRNEDE